MSTELYSDKYWTLAESGDLVNIQRERSMEKEYVGFENNKYNIAFIASKNGHFHIIKWLLELYNNQPSEYLYKIILNEVCETRNKKILEYLYSLHIFQTREINSYAFSCAFYIAIYNYDVDFIDYMFSLFTNIDIANTTHVEHLAFGWACKHKAISRARWIATKKPYDYELIVNDYDKEIMFHRIVPKKERRWNQLKTVLWMSQVKPTAPSRSSMFRFISNDVVKIMCEYL